MPIVKLKISLYTSVSQKRGRNVVIGRNDEVYSPLRQYTTVQYNTIQSNVKKKKEMAIYNTMNMFFTESTHIT